MFSYVALPEDCVAYLPMVSALREEARHYFDDLFNAWDDRACGMSLPEFLEKSRTMSNRDAWNWASQHNWENYPNLACPRIPSGRLINALCKSDDPIISAFGHILETNYRNDVEDGFRLAALSRADFLKREALWASKKNVAENHDTPSAATPELERFMVPWAIPNI